MFEFGPYRSLQGTIDGTMFCNNLNKMFDKSCESVLVFSMKSRPLYYIGLNGGGKSGEEQQYGRLEAGGVDEGWWLCELG